MLYLFDLDGTLISSYMDTPDKNFNDWEVLPGRYERLKDLQERGHTIGIVTNQAGVAFGFSVNEFDAWEKIYRAIIDLGLPLDHTPVYVCFAHKKARDLRYRLPSQVARRKPSGTMIREALADYPEDAALGALYVGDRQEDYDAAKDAGVPFQWAHIFFKDSA
jgi:D-glycero-D-manno-heptose 1,7-bisphosphate phosphatase